ncbi:MAG: cache domain-containing protein, partial [Anaerolineae bacterium]|nr:cache domain-containing protein [Anaerolineae bacterium]
MTRINRIHRTTRRTTIQTAYLAAFAALLGLLLWAAVPIALGGPAGQAVGQVDATQQQQTVEALVNQRFTATAQVQAALDLTATAHAATVIAPTLTAQFEATVDAAFNQAMTGTAAVQATQNSPIWQQAASRLIALGDTKEAAIREWLAGQIQSFTGTQALGGLNPVALNQPDALVERWNAALNDLPAFEEIFAYALYTGQVVVATNPNRIGTVIDPETDDFAASMNGFYRWPVEYDTAAGVFMLQVSLFIPGADGTTGYAADGVVIAGRLNLSALDSVLALDDTADSTAPQGVEVYLVEPGERWIIASSAFPGGSTARAFSSAGIDRALAGENGTAGYRDYNGQDVIGAFRWLADLDVALLVEQPESRALAVPPTATPVPPTPAPGTPTPRPEIFPTDVTAQVQIVEQVFEHGRLFWIMHSRQIWVMQAAPDDPNGGDWFCYNDTFIDGEMETDPALVPPEGMYQPRRGFGKLWRTNPDIKTGLGWGLTPEFDLTSSYTYIAG